MNLNISLVLFICLKKIYNNDSMEKKNNRITLNQFMSINQGIN